MNSGYRTWDLNRLKLFDEHNYCSYSNFNIIEDRDCEILQEPLPSNVPDDEIIIVDDVDEEKLDFNPKIFDGSIDFLDHYHTSSMKSVCNGDDGWVPSAIDVYEKLRVSLLRVLVELRIYSYLKDEARKIFLRLILKKICRIIRKAYARAYWKFESILLIHKYALTYLIPDLLDIYTHGYAELMRKKKINLLLSHINVQMIERNLLTRFKYEDFLFEIKTYQIREKEGDEFKKLPDVCSLLNDAKEQSENSALVLDKKTEQLHERDGSKELMALLCPYPSSGPNMSIQNLLCSALYSRSASSSNLSPSFVCLTYPYNCNTGRLFNYVSYLNLLGNVSLESPEEQSCDTLRLRLRLFTRRVISVLEEQRNGPVFVVGFGLGSVLALISLLHLTNNISKLGLPSTIPSANNGKLGLSGVPIGSNNSWISGFISLGVPLLGIKGDRGSALDPLLSLDPRYSGLFVVGSESRLGNADHMRIFRNKLLNKHKNNPLRSPVGMRILSVDGADHLLRIRPSKAKRWMVCQEMVDRSIGFHIAQFVGDCKEQFLTFENSPQNSQPANIGQSSPLCTTASTLGQDSPLSNNISEDLNSQNSPSNSVNSFNTSYDYQTHLGPPPAKHMRSIYSDSTCSMDNQSNMGPSHLDKSNNKSSSSSPLPSTLQRNTIFRSSPQLRPTSSLATTSNRFTQQMQQRSQPRILQNNSGQFPTSLNIVSNFNSLILNKNKPITTFAISLQSLQNQMSNQENSTAPRTLSFLNNLPINTNLNANNDANTANSNSNSSASNVQSNTSSQNRMSRRKVDHAEQRKNHLLRKQMFEENPEDF